MNAHEIRLRAGWECALSHNFGSGPSSLTLPVRWDPATAAGRWRLMRRFNRPPRVAAAAVVLRLLQAPGVVSVSLNGRPIGPISPGCAEHDLVLGVLAPRNVLVLEVEPPADGGEWGVISLVFPPR